MRYLIILFMTVVLLFAGCHNGEPYLESTAVEIYAIDSMGVYFSEPFVALDTSSYFHLSSNRDATDSIEIINVSISQNRYGILFKLNDKFVEDCIYQFSYSPLNCKIQGSSGTASSSIKISGNGNVKFKIISLDSLIYSEVIE